MAELYSNIKAVGGPYQPNNAWKNISYSERTKAERDKIKYRLDNFATFMWRGVDAWENFGAFIIADKQGDLKLYNGPSFSNNYTSPQFDSSAGNLLGVTFKQQAISFKIGVYWISIENYQKFLDWLSPYEINYLSFGFAQKWGYLVKLASISDSPRYVVGNENGEPQYYTELTLKWEVQGPQCVRANSKYEWNCVNSSTNSKEYQWTLSTYTKGQSKIDTPIEFDIPLKLDNPDTSDEDVQVRLVYEYGNFSQELFNIVFDNLTYSDFGIEQVEIQFTKSEDIITAQILTTGWKFEDNSTSIDLSSNETSTSIHKTNSFDRPIIITKPSAESTLPLSQNFYVYNPNYYVGKSENEPLLSDNILHLHYDSESGLLYLLLGNTTSKLLSLVTNTVTGDNLVKTMLVNKFKLPGEFTMHQEDDDFGTFILTYTKLKNSMLTDDEKKLAITCYARANVI